MRQAGRYAIKGAHVDPAARCARTDEPPVECQEIVAAGSGGQMLGIGEIEAGLGRVHFTRGQAAILDGHAWQTCQSP